MRRSRSGAMTIAMFASPCCISSRSSRSVPACRDPPEHLRRAEVADEPARERGPRLVEHGGRYAPHVEVDRITEEQQLDRRNADDEADRDAVARELAHLLARDREQAAEPLHAARPGCAASARSLVAATNTSSSEAPTVLDAWPAGLPSASAARSSASGSRVPAATARAGGCRAARCCAPPRRPQARAAPRRNRRRRSR